MKLEIEKIISELKITLSSAKNLEDIKQIRAIFTTKSDFLNDLKNKVKNSSSIEDKKTFGQLTNLYLSSINSLIKETEDKLSNNFVDESEENYFLSKERVELKQKQGFLHPLTKIQKYVENYFLSIGFTQLRGQIVDDEKYNFDFLNIPKDHISRQKSDTFYLNHNKLLISHCTNMTARTLEQTKSLNSFKAFTIGDVFRNDDDDPRHSFQFMQIDFFGFGNDVSVSSLKWIIDNFLKSLFSKESKTNYRMSFFPFTEPSFEVDVTCPACNGKGCQTCSNSTMLEILGCGILNNKVLLNTRGKKDVLGFAAGIGLERIAMIKEKISDIRNFYSNDLNFLRGNKNEISS